MFPAFRCSRFLRFDASHKFVLFEIVWHEAIATTSESFVLELFRGVKKIKSAYLHGRAASQLHRLYLSAICWARAFSDVLKHHDSSHWGRIIRFDRLSKAHGLKQTGKSPWGSKHLNLLTCKLLCLCRNLLQRWPDQVACSRAGLSTKIMTTNARLNLSF